MISWEATNTNFIVFGVTHPVLESMIYSFWGKHTNHYITEAVPLLFKSKQIIKKWKITFFQMTIELLGVY